MSSKPALEAEVAGLEETNFKFFFTEYLISIHEYKMFCAKKIQDWCPQTCTGENLGSYNMAHLNPHRRIIIFFI